MRIIFIEQLKHLQGHVMTRQYYNSTVRQPKDTMTSQFVVEQAHVVAAG